MLTWFWRGGVKQTGQGAPSPRLHPQQSRIPSTALPVHPPGRRWRRCWPLAMTP